MRTAAGSLMVIVKRPFIQISLYIFQRSIQRFVEADVSARGLTDAVETYTLLRICLNVRVLITPGSRSCRCTGRAILLNSFY